MNTYTIFLLIIMLLILATASGIMYWMAMKNFESHKYGITYVIILSIMFTPAGAWLISPFYKLPKNISALRNDKHKAGIIS